MTPRISRDVILLIAAVIAGGVVSWMVVDIVLDGPGSNVLVLLLAIVILWQSFIETHPRR